MKRMLSAIFAALLPFGGCGDGAPGKIHLEVNGQAVGTNPTTEELRAVLEGQVDSVDSFFILSQSNETYLQGAFHEGMGFHLEYQVGDISRHFAATDHHDIDKTLAILESYVSGNDEWLEMCAWEKMEI